MPRTVLITGCSTGIGRAAALHFAAQGWNVAATMRGPDPALADAFPDRIFVAPLDVADPDGVTAAIAATVARFGTLDLVVNNAGITILSIFEATPPDAARRIFETNLFGPMNVIRAALPHLRAGGGTIVNVTSGVGIAAMPLLSLYSASKQALEGLSESLSYELESQGIAVKLVESGAVRTTSFTASGMAASQDVPVPAGYQGWFDHMLRTMIDYPFPDTEEQAVVETIYRAATDPEPRLRYPIGPDVEEYARLRWSTSEDEYRAGMRRLTGQEAWLERGRV